MRTMLLAGVLAVAAAVAAVYSYSAGEAGGAVWTVNTTDPPGDGVCEALSASTDCSIADAITALANGDSIHFGIPGTDAGCSGSGVCTIIVPTSLSTITESDVTIDGYTQAGATANTLAAGNDAAIKIHLRFATTTGTTGMLRIDGANADISGLLMNGLTVTSSYILVTANGDGAHIHGNIIGTDLSGLVDETTGTVNGIRLDAVNDVLIGGPSAGERNLISAVGYGIFVTGAPGTTIQNNYLGTDLSGIVDIGNDSPGIYLTGATDGTLIGGGSAAERNVISGNTTQGVWLADASGVTVQGNYIGLDATGTADLGNSQSGIHVQGATGTVIGGIGAGQGNVISGNGSHGINVLADADGTTISGNLIGTNASGTAAVGNASQGIDVGASTNTVIGGGQAAARNVISGNGLYGIDAGTGATGLQINRNFVGTNTTGTAAIANKAGINVTTPDLVIKNSVVSGNTDWGIRSSAAGTVIQGNRIGTNALTTAGIANGLEGITLIAGASDATIGGAGAGQPNVIAFNTAAGIAVSTGASADISANSMRQNGGLGIDLLGSAGATPNDAGDGDSGGNSLQNWPVVTTATVGSTRVEGTLDSLANRAYRLELFTANNCDGSGNGEGRVFRGSAVLAADPDGNIDFAVLSAQTAQVGDVLTATVTDLVTNETSEFSNCITVEAPPTPTPIPTGPTASPGVTPTPTASPIPVETPGPTAEITDEPTPIPTPSPTGTTPHTPTPAQTESSATPTAQATATATATPAPTGADILRQGDVECSGQVSGRDALWLFLSFLGLEEPGYQPCPDIGEDVGEQWGDVDCDGDIDEDDGMAILIWLAGLEYEHEEPCVPMSEVIAT